MSNLLSGGDEKVLRLFEPPFSFVKNANSLSDTGFRYTVDESNAEIEAKMHSSDAIKQPLGLMNKPVLKQSRVNDD